jgi:hypothetical protein
MAWGLENRENKMRKSLDLSRLAGDWRDQNRLFSVFLSDFFNPNSRFKASIHTAG